MAPIAVRFTVTHTQHTMQMTRHQLKTVTWLTEIRSVQLPMLALVTCMLGTEASEVGKRRVKWERVREREGRRLKDK